METRHVIAFALLAILSGVAAYLVLTWRLRIRRDRIMRWGSAHNPAKPQRRASSKS